MTRIQVQNWEEKKEKIKSLKYTPVTQIKLCFIFLMYVPTTQHSNYGR